MKYEIKSRWSDETIYIADILDGKKSGMQARVALEKAVSDHANLGDADLGGADLGGANLRGANLRGADLGGANLRGANLGGADLRGANLRGADLRGAYLGGAYLGDADLGGAYLGDADAGGTNLRGADLRDAYLGHDLKLVGSRPVLCIGPIGSVSRTIFAWITDHGLRIQAGCFFGTRDEFIAILAETHGDNEHAREYTAALTLIDAHVLLWTPSVEERKEDAA